MTTKKLEVVLTGDTRRFGSAFNQAEGRLSSFGSKFRTFAGGMVTGMATAFAVDKVVGFGSQLFDLGQSLEVMEVKAATVFEGATDSVKAWADEANEALGMSDEKLVGLAANFGDLLKPMGFTAREAADMSVEVLDLSGALSAWSQGQYDAAEVSEILAKAMLGEREQLKSLGISIQEADVQARLAAKGQQDLTGAALQQAKAIATQELIFEKSTDAQKAWSDGSMDNLKATNELKAAWEDAQVVLAEKFLPIVQGAFGWIRDNVLPIVQGVTAAFQEGGLAGAFTYVAAEWSKAWPQLQAAIGNIFTSAVDAVSSWVSEGGIGNALGGVATTILEALGVSEEDAEAIWEGVKTAWSNTVDWLIDESGRFTTWVEEEFGISFDTMADDFNGEGNDNSFVARFNRGVDKINEFLGPDFHARFMENTGRLFTGLGRLASGIFGFLRWGVGGFMQHMTWLMNALWGVAQMVGRSIEFFVITPLTWAGEKITELLDKIPDLGGLGDILRGPAGFVDTMGGLIPGRAAGGPVAGGMPYIVGERGPELFVPSGSGRIVPNGALGGAGVVVVQIGDEELARVHIKGQRAAALAGLS